MDIQKSISERTMTRDRYREIHRQVNTKIFWMTKE